MRTTQKEGDHGDRDQADGEQCDRPCVTAQVAQVGVVPGGVHERREEDEEDDLGVDGDVGHCRG